MDYLLFCQGVLLLGGAILLLFLRKFLDRVLPVPALGLFGIVAALYCWLLMLTAWLPRNVTLGALLEFYAVTSAICLFEAGRWMVVGNFRKRVWLVLYLAPVLIFAVLFYYFPRLGPGQLFSFAFGVPGAFLAAWGLVHRLDQFRGGMRRGVALLAGVLVSVAAFYAANRGAMSVSPYDAFVQQRALVAGLAATLVASGFFFSAWILFNSIAREDAQIESTRKFQRTLSVVFLTLAAGTLIVGAFLTEYIGRQESNYHRNSLLFHARLLADELDTGAIEALEGKPSDAKLPEYHQLKQQLRRFRNLLPQSRFVYVVGKDENGAVFFFADSEAEGADGFSPPGSIYPEAGGNPEWHSLFGGKESVVGPVTDSFGTWVSASVPIALPVSGRVVVLGVDIPANQWLRGMARARLAGIAVTGLLLGFFSAGFATFQVRLRTETELDLTRRQFDLALQGAGIASWELDPRTGAMRFDQRWRQLVENALPPPATPENFFQHIAPAHRQTARDAVRAHLAGEIPSIDLELPLVLPATGGIVPGTGGSARELWVLWKGSASAFSGDAPILVSGILQSIEERRRLQEARQRNQRVLEAIVLLNSHLISARLTREEWEKALEILGEAIGLESVHALHCHAVASGDAASNSFERVACWPRAASESDAERIVPAPSSIAPLKAGRIPLTDFSVLQNQPLVTYAPLFCGSQFWGVLAMEFPSGTGAIPKETLALLRSATAAIGLCLSRQRGEDALRRAMEDARILAREAVEANQAKSTFLATMSHEIRTPLNAVIGMTSMLQETQLDPTQREFSETIYRAGNALLDLINDILDYSKIESGRVDLHDEEFDLYETVLGAIEIAYAGSGGKDLAISSRFSPGFPTRVRGDGVRMRQVLLNLLSNAVKFTESGSVCIDAGVAPTDEGLLRADFVIEDTGIGMEPQTIERLFSPFQQADSSITRKFGGSGLGLAICKRIIELMGGEVVVESTPGVGTRFSFHVLLRAVSPPPRTIDTPPDVRERLGAHRIVLGSPCAHRVQSLVELVGKDCAEAKTARTPGELADAMESAQPPPTIVLIDWKLLQLHTAEESERLRENLRRTRARMVVLRIMQSTGDRSQLPDGAEFFPLPIRSPELQMFLTRSSEPKAPDVPVSVPERQPDFEFSKLRVLAAEDNPNNQAVLRLMLKRLGCTFLIVENGKLALEALASEPYDLVILDLQMPVMDGLTAARKIAEQKKELGTSRPALLALTANAFQEDRRACLAAGFDDYLAKPVKLVQLSESIASIFDRHPRLEYEI